MTDSQRANATAEAQHHAAKRMMALDPATCRTFFGCQEGADLYLATFKAEWLRLYGIPKDGPGLPSRNPHQGMRIEEKTTNGGWLKGR